MMGKVTYRATVKELTTSVLSQAAVQKALEQTLARSSSRARVADATEKAGAILTQSLWTRLTDALSRAPAMAQPIESEARKLTPQEEQKLGAVLSRLEPAEMLAVFVNLARAHKLPSVMLEGTANAYGAGESTRELVRKTSDAVFYKFRDEVIAPVVGPYIGTVRTNIFVAIQNLLLAQV
jgi:hypothetical protein